LQDTSDGSDGGGALWVFADVVGRLRRQAFHLLVSLGLQRLPALRSGIGSRPQRKQLFILLGQLLFQLFHNRGQVVMGSRGGQILLPPQIQQFVFDGIHLRGQGMILLSLPVQFCLQCAIGFDQHFS
jgi:hypothetical protein